MQRVNKITDIETIMIPGNKVKVECFKLSFTFPRRDGSHNNVNSFKAQNRVEIGRFISNTSFPTISTNNRSYETSDESKFVNCSSPVEQVNRTKVREDNFRTRNRFIIARNVLGKMVQNKRKDVNIVSKIVSLVWKRNGKVLQNYFEYLSLLEAYWYHCLRIGTNPRYQSLSKLSGIIGMDNDFIAYSNVCSSSYFKGTPYNQTTTTYKTNTLCSKSSKFRITKLAKVDKKSVKKKTKLSNFESNFRINNCFFTNNFGILTEDMFLN